MALTTRLVDDQVPLKVIALLNFDEALFIQTPEDQFDDKVASSHMVFPE